VYACTHAWWGPDGPADDPLGTNQAALHQSRVRILEVATVIVPGHGPAFHPGPHTPALAGLAGDLAEPHEKTDGVTQSAVLACGT
jgi:hypothetical protein